MTRPLTARGERTRAGLVVAARTVFERDGFTDARLTDITAEAGCATGSFYTYFDSKEDILDAVLAAAQEEMLHPGLHHGETGRSETDPIATIEAANRAYFEAYRRNARLMMVREQVAGVSPEFRAKRLHRGQVFVERNAKSIKELQDAGHADPDLDPLLAAGALSGMVSRMAYQAFGVADTDDLETLVFTATRLWVNALGLR
ncbi:TetR/AcrR family transcriptional regulator [Gordonia sp. LSe1-13]|uniref:TetR/AcrR family transcriptional regulator n=1 Tax=Gordonia sesuvii TaxID=3116777 RepID=A0ABU7MFI4_9ACTN|nr:TetR/AcrR family transcriptional regulator [Gordonia sp. LSe1-13]